VIIHVAIEDYESPDDEDTPGSVADDDLRAELAEEAAMYAWLERGEE
jgi:hypothetical protein